MKIQKNFNGKLKKNKSLIQDFETSKGKIEYRSPEYESIILKKILYSLRGYKSDSEIFDKMIKNEEIIFIEF